MVQKAFETMKQHPASILALGFVAVVACVALAVYRDYGISWDEPEYYEYARSIRYAYSLEDHLQQDFRLEAAFESTSYFHRFYGPAYLLVAGGVVDVLHGVLPGSEFDLWHLVNFLTFLAGGVCLYWLAGRWLGRLASFGVLSLYILQPVLWGSGYINPKDIPFTTFFVAAVLAGYRMIDAASANLSPAAPPDPPRVLRSRWQADMLRLLPIVTLATALVLVLISKDRLLDLAEGLVRSGHALPDTFAGRLLRFVSPRVEQLAVEAYVHKAGILTLGARLVVAFGLAAGLAIAGWFRIPPVHRRLGVATCIAGIALGLVTSTRVLGPLAGAVVFLYALSRPSRRVVVALAAYGAVAAVVAYATWPYLWGAPIRNFLHVLGEMASVPETLNVLYAGRIVSSESLPFEYLPRLMLLTLTETTLVLTLLGGWCLVRRSSPASIPAGALLPIALWFVLPVGYAVATALPIHDAYRHFFFVLPPLFLLAGLGLEAFLKPARSGWLRAVILVVSLAPGVYGILLLHPYEYTHFNLASGGMRAAYHNYETDYWLTCYREAMQSAARAGYSTVYVYRQPTLAGLYAPPGTTVETYLPSAPEWLAPRPVLLLTTRENLDLAIAPESETLLEIGRGGAIFCVVKSLESAHQSPGS